MSEVASTKVPLGQKIAFGVGMLANQMFPAAMSIFMVVLVQDLGFPGWMWGVIFFAPRAFDAVLDPIMGFISDNTRSRWGRRRKYVYWCLVNGGFLHPIMAGISREHAFLQLHILHALVICFLPRPHHFRCAVCKYGL